MPYLSDKLVLPRPGGLSREADSPVSAPPESAFTKVFGTLLPPAEYLKTSTGRAAYYDIPPSSSGGNSTVPERVLLVHGVQTPALGLLPLVRTLQKEFPYTHFVLFDHWGHGLSDTPIRPHEPSLFHHLIDALLDHLDWPDTHMIGYSFGGSLTAGYVASRTSRVKSFIMVAPAGLLRISNLSSEEQGHMRGGGDEEAAQKWVHSWLEGGELIVPEDWEERVSNGEVVATAIKRWELQEHAGHAASVVGIVRDGHCFENHATFIEAAHAGLPSLVVLGELDGLCTKKDLEDLGLSNVVVVPRAGHGVVRENVPEVATLIGDFWKAIGKTNST